MVEIKDLVRFNRYKNVESFNNATDITSSTISIVKLDENIMDIYLGRVQLTHSNFPNIEIELRDLIESLDNKLNSIKTEFDYKLSYTDEKYNKEISKYISDFENNLNDLINHTDKLSKEIIDIKSNIQKNNSDTNKQIIDISKSITDINVSISEQNKVSDELLNKVGDIISKQTSTSINIKNLKQDVDALKKEDVHIFELIENIQNKLNITYTIGETVSKDVEKLKNNVDAVSKDNTTIKTDVIRISNNISNINASLSKRVNITESDIAIIKKNISELDNAINGENVDIEPIISDINSIKKSINDISKELLQKIESNVSKINRLTNKDVEFTNDISEIKKDIISLKIEDEHIFKILNELQSINTTLLYDIKYIKEEHEKINDDITSIKEKIKVLSGVDVENFETLEGVNRRLNKLESTDKVFKQEIGELKETIKNGIDIKLNWLIL